ncbi:hypothetical protein [Streptomyces hokutonensis]|uniref:Uncharacterized protein n=1 Tax=Streptomyces hokutonensis TaxID=1306990 RepID=A0ABW6ML05_9ACTN
MSTTEWQWRDGSSGAGHLQRVASNAVFTRTQTAYRAGSDHAQGCATCAVDSGQCATAVELWSMYRATTT